MAYQGGVAGRNYTTSCNSDLWIEILRRVPQSDRLRHVPLVSRLFSEACRDPSLWPELQVAHHLSWTEARWRSFLRWMAVRAYGLQKFVFINPGWCGASAEWQERIPKLIAVLADTAPQLRSLEYSYPNQILGNPASALPAGLGRLSQLTSLTLGFGTAAVSTAQVDAMVQTLPLLQHLSLNKPRLAKPTPAAPCGALRDGFPVGIATSCSQLKHLEFHGVQLGAVPPELGRLTALTRLTLDAGVSSLPDSISQLLELRELELSPMHPPSLPPGLTACQRLTRLDMGSTARSPALSRLQSLQRLGVPSEPRVAPYWTQLTALTELHLLCVSRQRPFPAGVGNTTALRKLRIVSADLKDLPAGPYLSCLESLRMEQCTFTDGVPASLAAAMQLRHLDLAFKNHGIELKDADVALLSSLPALATLSVQQPASVDSTTWTERLVEFQAAWWIAQGRAPPAIQDDPVDFDGYIN